MGNSNQPTTANQNTQQSADDGAALRGRRLRMLIRGGSINLNTGGFLSNNPPEVDVKIFGRTLDEDTYYYPNPNQGIKCVTVKKKSEQDPKNYSEPRAEFVTLFIFGEGGELKLTIREDVSSISDPTQQYITLVEPNTDTFDFDGFDPSLPDTVVRYLLEDEHTPPDVRRLVIKFEWTESGQPKSSEVTIDFDPEDCQFIRIKDAVC